MSFKKDKRRLWQSMLFAYAVAAIVAAVMWFSVKGFPSLNDALPFVVILGYITVVITVMGALSWIMSDEDDSNEGY